MRCVYDHLTIYAFRPSRDKPVDGETLVILRRTQRSRSHSGFTFLLFNLLTHATFYSIRLVKQNLRLRNPPSPPDNPTASKLRVDVDPLALAGARVARVSKQLIELLGRSPPRIPHRASRA